ncbi:MAG: hypothetical protein NWQ54_02415 [Paraglaciecola sp.]|nr:hypothetical protein [Paraglaciecola sp.]
MKGWLSRTFNSPVSHLVISTLLFGVLTFVLFWLTLKFNLLPQELLPSKLSQENTGLFDALGGWALGFAGALVAIRIAGLAANIQQNDSIREQVNVWARHVERISDLNSRITRATYDAKRACAAVLLHAEELYITEELPSRTAPHLSNRINHAHEPSPTTKETVVSEDRLQNKLEEKLEILIESIEEAFKDSVFRSVLEHANNADPSNSNQEALIDNYFVDSTSRIKVVEIIKEDTHFYNISEGLNRGSRNFGVGLMELRAKRFFLHFRKDLMRITEFQKQRTDIDGKKIEISDAAWLLLGLLLLRSKGNADQRSQNHGFIFIALLLGSLPTDETVSKYLNVKALDVKKTYSRDGNEHLKMEIKELSKRLYFVKGKELEELSELVATCNGNLEYLEVYAKNTGISSVMYGAKNQFAGIEKGLDAKSENSSSVGESFKNTNTEETGPHNDKKGGD